MDKTAESSISLEIKKLLPPFRTIHNCKKCQESRIISSFGVEFVFEEEYKLQDFNMSYFSASASKTIKIEYIKVTCSNCGFSWHEQTSGPLVVANQQWPDLIETAIDRVKEQKDRIRLIAERYEKEKEKENSGT